MCEYVELKLKIWLRLVVLMF